MSGDGNFVAFESLASDLVPDDANNAADIFLRDRSAGVTVRVSGPGGADADGPSYRAALSNDGGWVAFCSTATNLVDGDTNGLADVFLWERATGAISRIEVAGGSESASEGCLRVAVSRDAGVIAFSAVTSGSAGVFVYDRAANTTTRIDPEANGPGGTGGVAVSGDGNIVVFDSVADNLIADDTNRSRDVFAYDRAASATSRISVRTSGSQLPGNSGGSGVSVNGDGRYVVFGSTAKGVVPGDSNGREDVFRRDRTEGKTAIVSINISGQSANNSSYSPAINSDGLVVAYTSMAANIVSGDGNRQPDVFLRGTTFLENAGAESGPEDTGAPEEEETAPVAAAEDDGTPLLLYGAIAGGVVVLLIAASLLLGRRGRA
jgi:Tol biopolymer transport system component